MTTKTELDNLLAETLKANNRGSTKEAIRILLNSLVPALVDFVENPGVSFVPAEVTKEEAVAQAEALFSPPSKADEIAEDAMIIERIQDSPERKVFSVDVGSLAPEEVVAKLEEFKEEFAAAKVEGETCEPCEPTEENPNGVADPVVIPAEDVPATEVADEPAAEVADKADDAGEDAPAAKTAPKGKTTKKAD
jgi:hypothetical protein